MCLVPSAGERGLGLTVLNRWGLGWVGAEGFYLSGGGGRVRAAEGKHGGSRSGSSAGSVN